MVDEKLRSGKLFHVNLSCHPVQYDSRDGMIVLHFLAAAELEIPTLVKPRVSCRGGNNRVVA